MIGVALIEDSTVWIFWMIYKLYLYKLYRDKLDIDKLDIDKLYRDKLYRYKLYLTFLASVANLYSETRL